MAQKPTQRSLLINHLILLAMNVLTNSAVTGHSQYEEIYKALPPFKKRGIAFFPMEWPKSIEKFEDSPYAFWNLSTQSSCTLIFGKQAAITCKSLPNNSIEIYINTPKPPSHLHKPAIKKLAYAICACANAYSNATVIIHSENIKDYEALICYLNAYQKIKKILTPKELEIDPPVPNFQITLQGGTYNRQEEKIDQAVKDILKDEEIHNLYQKAQVINPTNGK